MQKAKKRQILSLYVPHWGTEYKLQESKRPAAEGTIPGRSGSRSDHRYTSACDRTCYLDSVGFRQRRCLYIILLEILLMPPAEQVRGTAARMVGAMAQVTIEMDETEQTLYQ